MSRFDEHARSHHVEDQRTSIGSADVITRSESSAPGAPTRVALAAHQHGHVARLLVAEASVADAAAPLEALLHASTAAEQLGMVMPVANLRLWQMNPGAELATCAAAVVDWSPDHGSLHAVQAGPIDVWVRSAGRWESLFEREYLSPEGRERWGSGADAWADTDRVLDNRDHWIAAPVGRFERSITRTASAFDVTAVVISTIGACAQPGHFSDMSAWWEALHAATAGEPTQHAHGELGVLFAARVR